MRVAFVQVSGMAFPGGSFRVFQNLLAGANVEAASFVYGFERPDRPWQSPEFFVRERLHFGRLEHTRIAPWLAHARWLSWRYSGQKLAKALTGWRPSHVHAHLQGNGFIHAMDWCSAHAVPFSVCVHDDIRHLTKGDPWASFIEQKVAQAWQTANNRFVISEEIGMEYSARYGVKTWEQVTDGLGEVRTSPREVTPDRINLYFAGAVNIPYEQNIKALQQALKIYQARNPATSASITLRGGRHFIWEDANAPRIEVRPFGSPGDVQNDLEGADIVYLPLSIDPAFSNFAKFSLSTKMVSYLASGLPIFYHGPEDSAAYRLLSRNRACAACFSNDPVQILDALHEAQNRRAQLVGNALRLAREKFQLSEIRNRFWSAIQGPLPTHSPHGNS
jgi:hypothetical protein